MTADLRNTNVSNSILENATDFLNVGLELLLSNEANVREAKVAVISIQTSIELLLKYRLVKEHGIEAMIRGDLPAGNLFSASMNGSLRTKGFIECLDIINKKEPFNDIEQELITYLQRLRNSLIHFTADLSVEDVQNNVAWLLIRALAMFASGEERDQGDMQDYGRFLNPTNFEKLTNFKPYRDEAVDAALESLNGEIVKRCWACRNQTLSLRITDTYFCHCCGLTAERAVASYADCPSCREVEAVCFDRLNVNSGFHYGRCLECGEFIKVPDATNEYVSSILSSNNNISGNE